jgi:NADH-quinone oxidoreductase subunit H
MVELFMLYLLWPLVKIIVVVLFLVLMVMAMTYAERKVVAHIQVRLGPMRVGWHGILQPVADTVKLLFKEDVIPSRADLPVFILAPILVAIPAFLVFAVIPFGPAPFFIADLNVGILFILAISSFGILAILLGGWASNSKYPFMGGLRSCAQMISYELPMGLAIVSVLLITQNLSLVSIVEWQQKSGWWLFALQPVVFVIYFICGVAETNRCPFDLPEAESELVGGFHTEYSGIRFAFFFMAEYINMVAISCLTVVLFLGGWLRPFPNVTWLAFLDYIPPVVWFLLKTFFFLYLYLWIRGTFPRYRFDQLMAIGWKWFLPITLVNCILTAGVLLFFYYR